MSDLFLLSERQIGRVEAHFPRVDDRRVVSGIVYVIPDNSPRFKLNRFRHSWQAKNDAAATYPQDCREAQNAEFRKHTSNRRRANASRYRSDGK